MAKPKPNLSIDFDGTISYYFGWKGVDNLSEQPIPYAFDRLYEYIEKFSVNIFSCRNKEPGGIKGMKEWFNKHDKLYRKQKIKEDPTKVFPKKPLVEYLKFPLKKPSAILYIDDRSKTFQGNWDDPDYSSDNLLAFKTWQNRSTMTKDKPNLSIDFDGTISYYFGWKGVENLSEQPIAFGFDRLYEYIKTFSVNIFSCRNRESGGIKGMKEWFNKHDKLYRKQKIKEDPTKVFPKKPLIDYLNFPLEKPPAGLYIDDRSKTFRGNWANPSYSSDNLLAFKTWQNRPTLFDSGYSDGKFYEDQ